jgi:hypothetical protein
MDYFVNIAKRVWFGKELLWKVFWIYKTLIASILGLIMNLFIDENSIYSFLLGIYFVYHVWVLTGLYKCRFNCKNPQICAPLTTVFTLISALSLGFFVLNFAVKSLTGKALIESDPNIIKISLEKKEKGEPETTVSNKL